MIIRTNNASLYVDDQDRVTTVDQNLFLTSSNPKTNLIFCVPTQPQAAVSDDCSLPTLPLTFDTGYSIGAFIGDGWVSISNNSVFLSNVNPQIREAYMRGMESLAGRLLKFSIEAVEHAFAGKMCWYNKTRFSDRIVRDFLFGAIGHLAENKHLPPFWRGTSKEFRWGILSGMLDTDGTVSICTAESNPHSQIVVQYDTTSYALITDLMQMCQSMGLYGVLGERTTKAGSNRKNHFRYSLNSSSVCRMKGHVILQKEKHRVALASFEFRDSMLKGYASPELSKDQLKKLSDSGLLKPFQSAYSVVRRTISSSRTVAYIPYYTAVKIAKMDLPVFKTDADLQRWRDLVLDSDYEWHFTKDLVQTNVTHILPPAPLELRFAV